ncbi:hypothetical protein PR003_g22400 [Phytophthora rubi]|uniref:Uncharacterized protein n=1 Tax=Phytophthora rubi TaxID=129364 RepID=A0A6A3IVM0_9STRA|nr:hypothetical protein PR001_g22768 [Phytophthora rubi]KAE8987487.1 hypothetical protein PR002_g22034 [Phytophthora rubi]KAE9301960.1 hypothetical protein PR003_g22400 [Phytophthora rubi]
MIYLVRVFEKKHKPVCKSSYTHGDEGEQGDLSARNRVLFMYNRIISGFLKLLKRQSQKRPLKRLSSNRKVVAAMQDFHSDLDELFKLLNIAHMVEMAKWKKEWEEYQRRIHRRMPLERPGHPPEIQSSGLALQEGLVMIKFEPEHKKKQNDPEQLQLMQNAKCL